MQWRIWGLASAGKFFEGMIVFMTGVALPLLAREFQLSALQKGSIGAAPLFGILIGATALGSLADRYGRKAMFIAEMVLLAVFLMLLAVAQSFVLFLICLFAVGLALGCDYPTGHIVISESIPSRVRGRLVLSAFGFQAVGALFGTGVGYLILYLDPQLAAWRWMYAAAILPALRGKGAGLAASMAKIGAVTTAFFFPILLKNVGTRPVLIALVVTSLLGALLTWCLRIETAGVNLEKIDEERVDAQILPRERSDFDQHVPEPDCVQSA